MMHAQKRNMPVMVDYDRYGWLEADPARLERTRCRGIVNTFLAGRNYWQLMHWLAAKMPTHRSFLSIGEALVLARIDYALNPNDETRKVVVVARYFHMARWHWLDLPREAA